MYNVCLPASEEGKSSAVFGYVSWCGTQQLFYRLCLSQWTKNDAMENRSGSWCEAHLSYECPTHLMDKKLFCIFKEWHFSFMTYWAGSDFCDFDSKLLVKKTLKKQWYRTHAWFPGIAFQLQQSSNKVTTEYRHSNVTWPSHTSSAQSRLLLSGDAECMWLCRDNEISSLGSTVTCEGSPSIWNMLYGVWRYSHRLLSSLPIIFLRQFLLKKLCSLHFWVQVNFSQSIMHVGHYSRGGTEAQTSWPPRSAVSPPTP